MGARHAVLDDHVLAFAEGSGEGAVWRVVPVETARLRHAGEVAALGLRYGRRHVWIVPGSRYSQALSGAFIAEARPDWEIFPAEGVFPFMLVRKRSAGIEQEVMIAAPELDEYERWPLSRISDGRTLYTTVQYVEEALGMPLQGGPGKTGQDLLKQLHARSPRGKAWLRPLPPSELAWFVNHQSSDLRWIRPLTATEQRAEWVQVFDNNRQQACLASHRSSIGQLFYSLI